MRSIRDARKAIPMIVGLIGLALVGGVALVFAASLGLVSQSITSPSGAQAGVPRNESSINTTPSAGGTVGTAVSDSATLSGLTSNATGALTFTLYGPNPTDCSGTPVYSSSVSVTGNGVYGSGSYTPTTAGTYWWLASYAGDGNNKPVSSVCGDETVTLTPASSASVGAPSPTSGIVGSSVSIAGSGFAPSSSLTIKVGGTTSSITAGASSDGSGHVSATFTVPAKPAGPYTVVVTDASSNTATSATSFTVVPSITLSPSSGVANTSAGISGSGFAASSTITATFGGSAITPTGTTSTDASGSFSAASYTVPNKAPGANSVVVTDSSSNTASAAYTINTPAITITVPSPATGKVGSSVSVSGSNFPADKSLTATFAGSTVVLSGTTSTDATGAFAAAAFNVPATTAGSKTMTFSADSPARSASTSFTVVPSITLSPSSGVANTSAGISGSGFAASSTITATFGGSAITLTGATSTDASGSFSGSSYTVPNKAPGANTVVVTDSSTNTASAAYTISTPTITLSPTSGPSGTTVTVSGSGFPANKTLTGTFAGAAVTIGTTTSTDTTGAFSGATFTVPSSTAGAKTVTFSADSPARSASATFTLTGNFLITLTPTGSQTAGLQFQATLTATTNGVTTDTGYTGTHTITWSGPQNSPNGTAPVLPTANVSFASGVSTTVLNVTLYKAGANTLNATDATLSGSAAVTVAPAALSFTNTTVNGTSVTCSATTATDTGSNNVPFATKVSVNSSGHDAYDNPVTLPATGTLNLTLTLDSGASSNFNGVTNSNPTIVFPATTTSQTYSMMRSNSSSFTGFLIATDTSGTYGSVKCALKH